jgi:hypothetical protein
MRLQQPQSFLRRKPFSGNRLCQQIDYTSNRDHLCLPLQKRNIDQFT